MYSLVIDCDIGNVQFNEEKFETIFVSCATVLPEVVNHMTCIVAWQFLSINAP